jgi:hypothetical protein
MPRSALEYDLKTYTVPVGGGLPAMAVCQVTHFYWSTAIAGKPAPTFDLGWLMDPFNNQTFLRSNYERNQPSRWNSQEYLPLALVSFTLETTESLV